MNDFRSEFVQQWDLLGTGLLRHANFVPVPPSLPLVRLPIFGHAHLALFVMQPEAEKQYNPSLDLFSVFERAQQNTECTRATTR